MRLLGAGAQAFVLSPRRGAHVRLAAALLAACALASGCGTAAREATVAEQSGAGDWFVDGAADAGLAFTHFNGMSGELYMPEILPPGCALLDYDHDGDLDAFLVQGRMLGVGKTLADAVFPPPAGMPPVSRLFRNDLRVGEGGSRALRFEDVTAASGIEVDGYGMGAATGDYDNDGCVDLYVTSLGRNQLFRNTCDGAFTDVSRASGTDDDGWAVSAAFVDYDRDGWLDLFVGNYLHYTPETDLVCRNAAGERDYCSPQVFRARPDVLYRNRGDGTFADVSAAALPGGGFGPALGVTAADFDGDGWVDVYVANDGAENQLWMNRRDGTFEDLGLLSGAALSAHGDAEGSMGVDAGDFDNDGDEDLFMTHLPREGNNLYVNDGSGLFEERSMPSGLGLPSLGLTGFGTTWFDFDNDGWLDVLAANGAIIRVEGAADRRFPYGEPNLLLRNLGNGRFEDVTDRAGDVFSLVEVSRGAAFGDIDNDGDLDVLVGNNNGPARLLVNRIGQQGRWIGLRLVGAAAPRDMLGARVTVTRPDGSSLARRARADGSYASANDPRVLVGLGGSAERVDVRVEWPGGGSDAWTGLPAGGWVTLTEGGGR